MVTPLFAAASIPYSTLHSQKIKSSSPPPTTHPVSIPEPQDATAIRYAPGGGIRVVLGEGFGLDLGIPAKDD